MPEYLRLAMRDCIKRKDSTAIPDHLFLPGGAVADMAPHAPMVVFINPNSGGRHGPVLKERLQQLMSEEQVPIVNSSSLQLDSGNKSFHFFSYCFFFFYRGFQI